MAPTVCLTERQHTYIHCKQRVHSNGIHAGVIVKYHQTSGKGHIVPSLAPPESPLRKTIHLGGIDSYMPTVVKFFSSYISARILTDHNDKWNMFLTKQEGLLTIIVRTMALVRRNHLLQQRVNALRAETCDFIHSVLQNPENRCRQQYYKQQSQKQTVLYEQHKGITISSRSASNCVTSPAASSDLTSSAVTYGSHTCKKSKCDTDNEIVSTDSLDSDCTM